MARSISGSERRAAEVARDSATAADPATPTAAYDDAVDRARRRSTTLERELDHLRDRRRAAENAAIRALDRAHDLGIKNDPWYKRAWGAVDRWVDDHVDLVRGISTGLKWISAAAGLLSFIPILAPICVPIALAAGGAALAMDGLLAAAGHGSWSSFAVDAALMALPVAGKLVRKAAATRRVPVSPKATAAPKPPAGPKPPLGQPGAAEWRYQRYLADRHGTGQAGDALPFDEWKRRYYDPTANGGRPGRRGGAKQVSAKEALAREGIREVENVRLGGRYVDGVDPRPNAGGGADYYEVGTRLKNGLPEARERVKLADEIEALRPHDSVTFVDKADPSARIRYVSGDDVETKTLLHTGQTP